MRLSPINSFLWAAIVVALCSPCAKAQTADVAVVVNPKNTVVNLTMSELRKLFAGETKTWTGGTPVKVIVRRPGAYERTVALRLLGFSEDEYTRYWTTQAYRGEGSEPVAVFSNGMQKEGVIAIPGAIALMDVRDVKSGLKIVKVEGKLPGEDGYPLH